MLTLATHVIGIFEQSECKQKPACQLRIEKCHRLQIRRVMLHLRRPQVLLSSAKATFNEYSKEKRRLKVGLLKRNWKNWPFTRHAKVIPIVNVTAGKIPIHHPIRPGQMPQHLQPPFLIHVVAVRVFCLIMSSIYRATLSLSVNWTAS